MFEKYKRSLAKSQDFAQYFLSQFPKLAGLRLELQSVAQAREASQLLA